MERLAPRRPVRTTIVTAIGTLALSMVAMHTASGLVICLLNPANPHSPNPNPLQAAAVPNSPMTLDARTAEVMTGRFDAMSCRRE